MSILVNKNTRLLVQGITGKEGSYHAQKSAEYGANLVAGVTPGKGGQIFMDKVPIFDTVEQAVITTKANASLIFVPPPFAADAIVESVDAMNLDDPYIIGFYDVIGRKVDFIPNRMVLIRYANGRVERHLKSIYSP